MRIEKKILPEYFELVKTGTKTFELRLADWESKPGDVLVLREWDGKSKQYTGRQLVKEISYLLKTKDVDLFPKADVDEFGYQTLSFKPKPGFDYIGISTSFYCNDGNGNFLFAKRSTKARDEHGTWDPGGGKLEFGLTPEENALNEILEEYGCKGKIQEGLPAHTIIRQMNGQKTHWLAIPFFVLIDPKEAKNNEPHKFDEIGWFRLDNLPSPLHTGFAYTFNRYKAHFDKYL